MSPMTLVFFVVAALATCSGTAATYPFAATVLVRTPEGTPIADAPVSLVTGGWFGVRMTDAAGTAHFDIAFAEPHSGFPLIASLAPGFMAPLPAAEQERAEDRYNELRAQFAFPYAVVQQVPAGSSSAQFTISALPGVALSGRLVNAAGEPLVSPSVVSVTYSHSGDESRSDGFFVCRGVPKSKAGRLVIGPPGAQVWAIDLAAAQLATDLDIGPITIAPAPTTSNARLKSIGETSLFDKNWSVISDAATLVSANGQVIYCLLLDERSLVIGPATTALDPGYKMPLAPGTYYVAPGDIGSTVADKLLTLVRANRQVELDASNVPKFTAVEGQTVDFTLDPAAAKALIEAIPEQPPVTGGP